MVGRKIYGLFVALLLLACNVEVHAQSVYFNKLIEYNNETHFAPQVVHYDGDIYVLNAVIDSGKSSTSVYLSKTDSAGRLIWTNRHGTSTQDYDVERTLNLSDSTLYFIIQETPLGSSFSDIATIKSVSLDGKAISDFIVAMSDSVRILHSYYLEDGSFVCTGMRDAAKYDWYWFINRIDTNGNELFYKEYPWVGRNIGYTVHPTPDGGYVMGGKTVGYNLDSLDQSTIIKTDSVGNIEWIRDYGDRWVDYKAFCTVTDSGRIIASMTQNVDGDDSWPWDGWHRNYVVCLDMQGNLVWDKFIGSPGRFIHNATETVKQLSDGNIALIGSDPDYYFGEVGYIHKMTPAGDSIFSGRYRYSSLAKARTQHYLRDFTEMPNGDLVLAGFVLPYGFDSIIGANSNRLWLLRADSLGCMFPGCDTVCSPFDLEFSIVHDTGYTYTIQISDPVTLGYALMWDGNNDFLGSFSKLNYSITFPDSGTYRLEFYGADTCNNKSLADTFLYIPYISTGVGSIPEKQLVQLYPNPATQILHLQWQGGNPSGSITLYDLRGKAVLRQSVRESATLLDVSALPPALYLAVVRNGSGAVVWRKKVVVE